MEILDRLQLPDDIRKLNYEELDKLAQEVREFMLESVSKTGGHLAPSLGVVELTLALLKVFDPLNDRIVWDVGHQSYAYKILTDRKNKFHTLRQYGGISGFNKISESPYDAFGVGHTSTSIASALGIKTASDMKGKDQKVVAVIGDGAMTAGLAYEAINYLGHLDKNMIVILNDNEMSISPNVGAMSSYLSRIMTGEIYTRFRKDVANIFEHAPMGSAFLHVAKKMEEGLKGFFTPGVLFEEFGLKYIGPINGHNIRDLTKALHNAEIQDGPALIHVGTKKGKGFKPAEENPEKFHGVSAFDLKTGEAVKFGKKKTYTDIFGDKICEMAEKDENIVALTAAMPDGVGLRSFSEKFPDRFFDVGIAEQFAVTYSAGLAVNGLKPYVAIYSTFLQRAFDSIIHDVALQNLPVTFCIDRGGIVGADGPTHHGTFDLSYLRLIPNMTIMAPKDGDELEEMLELSSSVDGPVAIRYPRGSADEYDFARQPVKLGEPEIISDQGDYAIVSVGHIFSESYKLYNKIKQSGNKCSLVNLRFVKPLDSKKLLEVLYEKKGVILIEENALNGGACEKIQSLLIDNGYKGEIKKFGIPDEFVPHGDIPSLRKSIGLNADYIFDIVKDLWPKND
ncbi:1-deoxy-D-xylulose-5-phosphate synthase [Flexistipes sinusarabici DSM 4947]|uniref:1-deoxy-D-xylulose-5-phosphate synthase n=1 Tax=Flexistipes sinusarabici (strain ATCC 49648 / DSM 4947 / MAS 10) TaxID=717231 RepID=F8E7E1_FLESM|nr:1-deoxy-D-xylulose-5-phosphate synthase [Flexistipes sinusarabici]AEI14928.1 1-deoxy-D-xylulose-5-phosphate synthase [Flexistipes sinusarabici DSM 4947]